MKLLLSTFFLVAAVAGAKTERRTLRATFTVERSPGHEAVVKLVLAANPAYLFDVHSSALAKRLENRKGTVALAFAVAPGRATLLSVDDWAVPATTRWTSGLGCGEGHPSLPPCRPDGTPPVEPNPLAAP